MTYVLETVFEIFMSFSVAYSQPGMPIPACYLEAIVGSHVSLLEDGWLLGGNLDL